MHRIVSTITSISQHLATVLSDPDFYRPESCPHCGVGRPWHHGCYTRKADRDPGGRRNPIAIPRFLCGRGCGRSCSRLPECLSPRRWYCWAVQQAVLAMWLAGASLNACARAMDAPSRSTMRRWRRWIRDHGERFAFALRSRWPELGRIADRQTLWRSLLRTQGLSAVMAWLDEHACAVP